eukprot:2036177-Amphidinium_carterae.1
MAEVQRSALNGKHRLFLASLLTTEITVALAASGAGSTHTGRSFLESHCASCKIVVRDWYGFFKLFSKKKYVK